MERYVCIHGHFYQPPRENPWLEAIELQDSAYPFHDWNERITMECYAPNAAARILGDQGRICRIVNNYAKMSVNFGPTLLAWMEHAVPDVYQMILDADRASQKLFGGHGSALAQAYNHMIMPLANKRDKRSQVLWGIRDFESRFGRKPEGLWLPETAVDVESLETLAAAGIAFTILAPHQARRIRLIGGRLWQNVEGGRIDPTTAYQVNLPSGRSIAAFFYDGPISRAVAFEHLLENGEGFAQRLLSGFNDQRTWPQLMHIATDGETYGHHHRFGDMALAYATQYLERAPNVKLINYGAYLAKHPPTLEVEIVDNTSWSCIHGVERWRSNCGCNSGGHGEWTQAWRAPLRRALDWLRDSLAPLYERSAHELLTDPWGARDAYIDVILNRATADEFLRQQAARPLSAVERITALKLLEMQRFAQLMYTSCGWFFDELSGIETVQVLQYAGRAVQLGQELFGDSLEERFVDLLEDARSNLPEHRNGKKIYEKFVLPARVDLLNVGAHYAVSSLFDNYPPNANVYCYNIDRKFAQKQKSGHAKVALGRIRVTSQITHESTVLSYGVLHFGDHNLNGGVREYRSPEAYQTLMKEVSEAFGHADLPQIIRLLDHHFGGTTYSLRSLFRDEQRRILQPIIAATMHEAEAENRQIYEDHAPMMRFLTDLGIPLPPVFRLSAEVVLNSDLRHAVETENLDLPLINSLIEEGRRWNVNIDSDRLCYDLKKVFTRQIDRFRTNPADDGLLRRLESLAAFVRTTGLTVDLWKVQNVYWEMLSSTFPAFDERAVLGDENARNWVNRFLSLGDKLWFRVPD